MKTKYLFIFLPILLLAVALVSCSGGAPKVDWELKISGPATQISLSFQDLAKMEQIELKDVKMEKSTGEDELTSWSGVPLDALLGQAGVSEYSTITAVAGDGYAIEITRDELQGGIIALKDKGEWIAEVTPDKGPIRMVLPKTPGNRWVFSLKEIKINP